MIKDKKKAERVINTDLSLISENNRLRWEEPHPLQHAANVIRNWIGTWLHMIGYFNSNNKFPKEIHLVAFRNGIFPELDPHELESKHIEKLLEALKNASEPELDREYRFRQWYIRCSKQYEIGKIRHAHWIKNGYKYNWDTTKIIEDYYREMRDFYKR